MMFEGKKVLVTGIARSGLAAARVLVKRGAKVTICDRKNMEQLAEELLNDLNNLGIEIYAGEYPAVSKQKFDLVIASPGIPADVEPFVQARVAGTPVIGELELAYAIKGPEVEIIAVTGTNGKTTTVSLLHCIMEAAGINSSVGGNIGVPLSAVVDQMNAGVIAVEVSSFQLESIRDFRPHICGILNITPDHLDRHKTLESYQEVKGRIFANQQADDFAILNFEDPLVRGFAEYCPAQVVFFSVEQPLEQGISVYQGMICASGPAGIQEICPVSSLQLRGKHNLENVLCAVGMAWSAGIHSTVIASALASFSGVRHRMEEAGVKNGIMFVNDSKATNPDSAIKALQSFEQDLILIAGGRNKGSNFLVLANYVKEYAKAVVLLGEARDEINQALKEVGFSGPVLVVNDLGEAVKEAAQIAKNGDVVLLSPACASWDQFDNYEQRGDLFCELVKSL
ncbi:MAG: UDP-N-acetylmuramoyl-L-alanine--D-glutamate ligase [Syntrophomonadaceae bacterium]|nr:UDP-N-acetylmuramoyl-L-alanine--D-glutamate ligase [Syntrophomonadaceae bacterium]